MQTSAAAPTPAQIAHAFLPDRWHYHYARSKLASDPLYAGVLGALDGAAMPVLDLGCGIGLVAHYAQAHGRALDYRGVDNDAGKIAQAQAGAARVGLAGARFEVMDLARAFPAHRGSVLLLDVLQFLPAAAQAATLERIAACLGPGARLVMRTGLRDGSWRAGVTRAADLASHAIRWMRSAPGSLPTRRGLEARLGELGLEARFTPLWGRTPFNNWLVVAERR
ncbi:class I SAM-dependent methyltransferase [Coralloluteibacterium stylophorae]|uniref:Class I SAM-dependent methyltransferase n=1 Tax=Coralloluteibacterium stylophorae TaxID=1776034 RepID=A0A8J7VQT9_9GAMM|nr:class I SAM-dependent methyltransferase [Coralloluteibacterium stylophorae]MBS7458246.1 class I SAM-dependent methyltransferase [Coralloluteibacterium stylophorae]